MDVNAFRKELKQLLSDELVAGAKFVQKVFGLKSGDRGIITNGLLIGPLDDNEDFELNDFDLLEKFIVNRGAQVLQFFVKFYQILSIL